MNMREAWMVVPAAKAFVDLDLQEGSDDERDWFERVNDEWTSDSQHLEAIES